MLNPTTPTFIYSVKPAHSAGHRPHPKNSRVLFGKQQQQQQPIPPQPSSNLSDAQRAQYSRDYEAQGNAHQINRRFGQAVKSYVQAIKLNTNNTEALYNLAHTYVQAGQLKYSLPLFKHLLHVAPLDHQARTEYGAQLEALGQTDTALTEYATVLTHSPNYEPAFRRYQAIHFERGVKQFGGQSEALINYYGQQKIVLAQNTLSQFLKQKGQAHRLDILNNVTIAFEPTVTIDHVANIAEYDHATYPKPTIRFAPDMAFSHPDVLAAYLLHELVHAEDKDSLTSIQEEQDAYQEKTTFWEWRQSAIREPNLDYSLRLYKKSPTELARRVGNYYTMRDPSIPLTSPHHGQKHTRLPNLY